ncbi:hypothetical protein [Natrinema sp. CBA1119]|uniref:hypothetical protein n=1 Tax=Natrinema sp. CBA1119 TaxID=1608465 RepID=UPI001145C889|nr:hypothetical protein [Natrinema sp. CBA1119]
MALNRIAPTGRDGDGGPSVQPVTDRGARAWVSQRFDSAWAARADHVESPVVTAAAGSGRHYRGQAGLDQPPRSAAVP